MRSFSPARNPKLQLTAEQPLTGECWIPTKKDIPYPRARKKPQQGSRRSKIMFRIKPHTCQRHSEDSDKPCVHRDPESLQRLSQDCVWVSPAEVQVSNGLPQGQRLWVQQTKVWRKPSWRRLPLTPLQSHQKVHRTGEKDSERAQTKPCTHKNPGKRSSDPKRDWPRLAHECPRVSGGGMGQQWHLAGSRALSAAVFAWDLEGGHHYLHYLHSLASVKQ